MLLVDNKVIEGCEIIKQYIINPSGCYNTAPLYINLPIRLSHIITYCSFKYGYWLLHM